MTTLREYTKSLRQGGRIHFTKMEAIEKLSISAGSFLVNIHRLKEKGELISPARGLYIIIPPEDQIIGCIPAEQLVPILMDYWERDYYAGLLTSALYHGASHQKPQVFQIVTDKQIKALQFGRVKIQFVYKKNMEKLPTQLITVKTGYLKIATPELTVYDLLHYPNQVGGLNNIATILTELIERIEINKFKEFVHKMDEGAWVQRLGYILDLIDTFEEEKKERLINVLQDYLKDQRIHPIPLIGDVSFKGCTRNGRWKIIENTRVESDL